MATDEKRASGRRIALTVLDETEGEACSTCRSNEWIWDEEVQLVQTMNGIKSRVREARERGDEATVRALRDEFRAARAKMERVRRQRLDSLGHFDYD